MIVSKKIVIVAIRRNNIYYIMFRMTICREIDCCLTHQVTYFSFIHEENKLPDTIVVQISHARRV